MGNDKTSMVALLVVTIAVVGVCAGTIVFLQQDKTEKQGVKEEVVKKEPKKEIKREEKKDLTQVVKTTPKEENKIPLTEEEKKAQQREKWKRARNEMMKRMMEAYKGSEFEELMQKQMSEGTKKYLAELFEKHGIDAETQDLIASSITKSQSEFMEVLAQNGFGNEIDEDKRIEMAEELSAINLEAEEKIRKLGGDAFLEDAKEKRNTEMRQGYLKSLDWRLGKNKMSDKQRAAMDTLYAENQVSYVERYTLPKDELDQKKENINIGAKEILDEKQYSAFEKSNRDPFRSRGGMFGGSGSRWGGRRHR